MFQCFTFSSEVITINKLNIGWIQIETWLYLNRYVSLTT